MRRILVNALLFFSLGALSAQKVDIDNFFIAVNKAALPDNYFDPAKRSYSVKVSGDPTFANNATASSLNILGWSKLEKGGEIEVLIKALPFQRGAATPSSRKEERKDDNGKVISSVTYHKVTTSHAGRGAMYLFGEKNSYQEYEAGLKKAERDAKRDKKKK